LQHCVCAAPLESTNAQQLWFGGQQSLPQHVCDEGQQWSPQHCWVAGQQTPPQGSSFCLQTTPQVPVAVHVELEGQQVLVYEVLLVQQVSPGAQQAAAPH
jgi:hypothetical protein